MKQIYACLLGWGMLALGTSSPGLAQTTEPTPPAPAPTTAPAPAAATPAPAAAPVVAKAARRLSLEGQWQGPLTVPGGKLDVRIAITDLVNDAFFATLDMPQQRLSRVPLEVSSQGDTVIFQLPTMGIRFFSRRVPEGPQLVGQWEQPGYKTDLALKYSPLPPPPKNFKFQPPYRIDEVTITTPDKVQLSGTLTTPPGEGPFAAVVLLSDLGYQDRDAPFGEYNMFGSLADYLTRHRIAVLRLDDRGVGQSGGDLRVVSTPNRVQDAQAALNFLRTRPLLDVKRLGLIGHGEGGNVALLAATQPLPPAFVVTLAASGLTGLDHLKHQQALGRADGQPDTALANSIVRQERAQQDIRRQAEKMRADGANSAQVETFLSQQMLRQRNTERKDLETALKKQEELLEVVRQTADNNQAQAILQNMLHQFYPSWPESQIDASVQWMTTPWYRYYLDYNPTQGLAGVQCPVLLLHGTQDAQVPLATHLPALEKGLKANRNLTVRRLEGLNHQFQPPYAEWPLVGGQPKPVFAPTVLSLIHDWILPPAKLAK